MNALVSAISGASGAIIAVVLLLAALFFIPWSEPIRRAEALVRAWRGDHDPEEPRGRRRPRRSR